MLEAALGWLAASPMAEVLKSARYIYPSINAVHILGLATLFGAILALDLRLLGVFVSVPARPLAVVLPRVAGCGLAVAMTTGLLLFSVEPFDYVANPAFLVKVALVLMGAAHAIAVHASPSWRNLAQGNGAIDRGLKLSAAVSLSIWTSAIVAGRFIAF